MLKLIVKKKDGSIQGVTRYPEFKLGGVSLLVTFRETLPNRDKSSRNPPTFFRNFSTNRYVSDEKL